MTKTLEYSVLRTEGKFEIRQYPETMLVAVEGLSDNEAFGILFEYISGSNKSKSRIPMTAPVISTDSSGERIPMTTPVVSRKGFFAFVLPADYTASNSPAPADARASIVPLPARKVAVLRFRGRTPDKVVNTRTAELASLVKRAGLRTDGEPFLMRYNPPFTPGFLRRNEIAIAIMP